MTTRYRDFHLDQGSNLLQVFNYTDTNKANLSLSGYDARAQMRRSYYSANAVTLSANISDAANGQIQLQLAAAVTSNLKAGRWVYDVEAYTANDNIVIRVLEGIVTVMPGVTR